MSQKESCSEYFTQVCTYSRLLRCKYMRPHDQGLNQVEANVVDIKYMLNQEIPFYVRS